MGYFGANLINSGLSVYNMVFWRFCASTLCMMIILLPKYRMVAQTGREGVKILVYGAIFYSPSTILYFMASRYIGTGLAMVVFFVYPAIVMTLNIILYKARILKIYYLALGMLMAGIICLADMKGFTFDPTGIVLAILSAVFYAFYILVSKKVVVQPGASTLMVCAGCMITCFIGANIDSSFHIPVGLENWLNIICMAVICTALPIVLLLCGLKYISSEKASMLSVLEPVFVVLCSTMLLGETITLIQLIGIIAVLSGALITFLPSRANPES